MLTAMPPSAHASSPTFVTASLYRIILFNRLSQNVEMRLVSAQTKHDQISVCTVNAMGSVHVVVWLCSLRPDKIQDLVLAFPRDESVREDYLNAFPLGSAVEPLDDVELQGF